MHWLIDQNKSKEKAKSISPDENHTKRKPDNQKTVKPRKLKVSIQLLILKETNPTNINRNTRCNQ